MAAVHAERGASNGPGTLRGSRATTTATSASGVVLGRSRPALGPPSQSTCTGCPRARRHTGLSQGSAASSPPSPDPVQSSQKLPRRSQHAHRHAGALAGVGRLLILLPRPAAALVVLVAVCRGVRVAAVAPPLLARLTLLRARKGWGVVGTAVRQGWGFISGDASWTGVGQGQKPGTAPVA